MTVINAEAPVALGVERYENGTTLVWPLTTCCAASAKGSVGGVVCRKCYELIDDRFGDCWTPDEERGWDTYRNLLSWEECRDVEAVVAEAKSKLRSL